MKKEIVAKPKYKRVKAWAWKDEYVVASSEIDAIKWRKNSFPCTILIEAKYLKDKK